MLPPVLLVAHISHASFGPKYTQMCLRKRITAVPEIDFSHGLKFANEKRYFVTTRARPSISVAHTPKFRNIILMDIVLVSRAAYACFHTFRTSRTHFMHSAANLLHNVNHIHRSVVGIGMSNSV